MVDLLERLQFSSTSPVCHTSELQGFFENGAEHLSVLFAFSALDGWRHLKRLRRTLQRDQIRSVSPLLLSLASEQESGTSSTS